MRENHIIDLLEQCPLDRLGPTELEAIQVHTADCLPCQRAFQAAQASLRLLRERAAVNVDPPHFFETKVLAAIRERGLTPERSGLNVWQTVRPLVLSMAGLILMLFALTVGKSWQPDDEFDRASMNEDSPEWVTVVRDDPDDEMTYGQVLMNLYDPALDAGEANGK